MTRICPANLFIPFARDEIEQTIPERFGKQVLAHHDRLAVRTKSHSLTYGELDDRSDSVAAAVLEVVGTKPVPVALLFRPGARIVTAIMGTLKAGKMYVPLDPLDPPERTAFMLRDSGAGLILTDQSNRELAATVSRPECCVLDETGMRHSSTGRKLPHVAPEHPVYLFYTSGSTGQPKGVFDDHRNVLHNIMRYTNSLMIGADDRLTLLQSVTFSGTVSSLFGALLNGAAIFPVDVQREGLDGAAQWLTSERITMYHSVPSLFEQLLGTGHRLSDLRVVRLEGDACSPRHVRLYRERCPQSSILVNGLGTTETGIVRQYFITHDAPPISDLVPVGYATEDMDVLVTDEFGTEVPQGEAGQIRVRSRYLARGYWRNPRMTQGAFGPGGRFDQRVYRTGDVGRLRADGCLEYLGRSDSQVKILGQWVAIPPIESALADVEGVASAVVAATDGDGDRSLTGYLVPSVPPGPSVSVIRDALARRFPRYMIPSRYVVLDALPVDDNGKVDRRALPAAESVRPVFDVPYRPPVGDTESRLAVIWSELLKVAPVGRDDAFFHLGGDSASAMVVLLRVRQQLGVTLPDAIWLSAFSVADMAGVIETNRPSGFLVPVKSTGSRLPLFCVHAVMGEVLDLGDLASHIAAETPLFALQAGGPDGRGPLLTTVEAMADHYLHAIRTAQPQGPYRLGGYCFGSLVALEMAQQLDRQGESVAVLVMINPDPPDAPGGRGGQSMAERFHRHLVRLARLGIRSRVRYVLSRTWMMARLTVRTLGSRALFAGWHLAGYPHHAVPSTWRREASIRVHALAAVKYRPRPYHGRTVLFSSSRARDGDEDIVHGWQRLIPGLAHGVVECRREEIMVEPNVARLARQLNRALADAEVSGTT